MDELDWFHVAPNVPQPLQVKVHRLRLGNQSFEAYPHPAVGSGFFAVWIPPLGGDLTIEVAGSETSNLQLWSGMTPLRKVQGARLVHRIAPGTSGRFDVHVSPPDRALRATLSVEGWPIEADETPLVPWNFWYFPYNDTSSGSPAHPSSHDIQISAMRKYDRVVPPTPGSHSAESWERANHCRADGASWEGHCDPGAYASVFFQQPPPTLIRNGVTFTRHELELLAAEWTGARMATVRGWHHRPAAGAPAFRTSGPNVEYVTHLLKPGEPPSAALLRERYVASLGKAASAEQEVLIDAEAARIAADPVAVERAFGSVALSFWDFLMAETMNARDPIVGDVGPAPTPATPNPSPAQVWNHAIALLQLTVTELDGDPRHVAAEIKLVTNLDVPPTAPLGDGETVDVADLGPTSVQHGRAVVHPGCFQAHHYELEFRFAGDGAVVEKFWRQSTMREPIRADAWAPRRFGIPATPRPVASGAGLIPPGNTVISDAVLALVQLRTRYR